MAFRVGGRVGEYNQQQQKNSANSMKRVEGQNELARQGSFSIAKPRKGTNSAVTREKASMAGGWQLYM